MGSDSLTGVPVQRRSATEYGDDGIVRLGWPRCENRDVEKLQNLVADMMEDQDRGLLMPCKWDFSARKPGVAERRAGSHGQLELRAPTAGSLSNLEDESVSLLERLHRGDGCL